MRYLALLFCSLLFTIAIAQPDSSLIKLHEVTITGVKPQNNHITTNIESGNFATNIENKIAGISVRNYGRGMLASLSDKGLSSQNTQISWNGFPINQATNGSFDLNLITSSPFSNSSVNQMGIATIELNKSLMPHSDTLAVYHKQSVGQWATLSNQSAVLARSNKIWGTVSFSHTGSENNFSYRDLSSFGNPIIENKWGRYSIQNLSADIGFLPTEKQNYKFSYLGNRSYREIVPPMGVNQLATQSDIGNRFNFEANYLFKQLFFERINIGYVYNTEQLDYYDNTIGNSIFPLSGHFVKFNSESKLFGQNLSRLIKYQSIDWGADFRNAVVSNNNNYNNSLNFYSANVRLNYLLKSVKYDVVQVELHLQKQNPGSAFLNSKLLTIKNIIANKRLTLQWQTVAGNTGRNPTLNDLFWNPGGNPYLKPEMVYYLQSGINYKLFTDKMKFEILVKPFVHFVNNQIIWLPNNTFWSVENIEGNSSFFGIEYFSRLSYDLGNFSTTISTLGNQLNANSNENKVPIYVPDFKRNTSVTLGFKQIELTVNYSETGRRFTTRDNDSFFALPSFALLNASVEYNLYGSHLKHKFGLRSENILNTDYQWIYARPQPRRYFEFFWQVVYF